MADGIAALRKLQSGQALTDEEKVMLGLAPKKSNVASTYVGGTRLGAVLPENPVDVKKDVVADILPEDEPEDDTPDIPGVVVQDNF